MADADRNTVMVSAVLDGGLSVTEAARRFGVSRAWLHRLLARYRRDGVAGLQPASRVPRSSPTAVPASMRAHIVAMRDELVRAGWDAGAESIRDRMTAPGHTPPSRATIHRILAAADRVVPEPHKRPRSSWTRFEAACPNQCWQSDMTHWTLTDGTGVEILTWLDDHSRKVLHLSAHRVVTAPIVTDTFLATAQTHGLPASTLTDNGLIFTTRFAAGKGGPNHFEHVIASLGVIQKNGHPGHPQTQGKIERFHQTLKRWLRAHPADTLDQLQHLLEDFTAAYNLRPHRAIGRNTPENAYRALPKASPTLDLLQRHWRVRHDTVHPRGTVTIRWAGKLRHLAIGRAHHHTRVVILLAGADTLVVNPATGEILAEHTLDPDRDYQPAKNQGPLPKEGP